MASFNLLSVPPSIILPYPQPFPFVTSLSHYILPISCTASLLSYVHLLLFTGVFISQSLPPPGYPFLFSTKKPSIHLVSCEIHLLLSVYHPAIILWSQVLSLAHLRAVYPAWFYLHQNAGTRTGKYSLFLSINLLKDVRRCLLSPVVFRFLCCFDLSPFYGLSFSIFPFMFSTFYLLCPLFGHISSAFSSWPLFCTLICGLLH